MTSADTGGAFALLEVTAPPQSAVPLHVHTREDETFFILDGTIEAECGGCELTLHRMRPLAAAQCSAQLSQP